MEKKIFKAGIVQFDVRLGDVETNLSRARRGITNLARKGCDLVLLPEMWSTGFANFQLGELSKTTEKVLGQLVELSKDMGIVIIGSMPEKGPTGIYNTAYVVDRHGAVLESYRKVHLFSPTKEDRFFESGQNAVAVETSLGIIGLMICYDLRFPELCRTLALKGAHMVAVVAQWPAQRIAHWDVLLKARAIENQVFVFGVNRCGSEKKLVYGGHSRIISPWGETLASTGKRAASIMASIDLDQIRKIRKQIPCLGERVPDAYV